MLNLWAPGDCLLCGGRTGRERVCAACAEASPRPVAACSRCAIALEQPGVCGSCLAAPPAFDGALAAFEYRFPIDRVIRRFKFAGDLAAGRWLAGQLAERVAAVPAPDLLVAPPLASVRLRTRGFNQALEIARVVGRACATRVDAHALVRIRGTLPQPGLGRRERLANLRGAFRAARPLDGLDVAIVDDVMTTGATAEAIARALRAAGARSVVAWVVARTPQPRR